MSRGIYDRTFRRKPLPVPIEQIKEEYEKGMMTLDALSKRHGVTTYILWERLKEAGCEFRSVGCIPGEGCAAQKKGNFDKYTLESYRESPCKNENPFCVILRDFFRKMDGDPRTRVDRKVRTLELWDAAVHGDPEWNKQSG